MSELGDITQESIDMTKEIISGGPQALRRATSAMAA